MADTDTGEVAVEVAARQLGWVPQEDFRGASDKWVDAETFVRKGRTQLPILLENNRRLERTVADMSGRMQQMQQLVIAGQESMDELITFHEENVAKAVIRERERLTEKLVAARKDEDIDEEVALMAELSQLTNKPAAKEKPVQQTQQQQQQPVIDPAFTAWQAEPENAWFGKDARKTALAVGIARELREDPANADLKGRAFYEKISEELEAYVTPGQQKLPVDRVAGGRGPAGGAPTAKGAKTYGALPADAKEVCDNQAKKFVGAGKAFKTAAEWQSYYAKEYFRE